MSKKVFSPQKGFFSVKEFCQWVSIGTTTFYKLVSEGKIKPVKIGSKTLVSYPEALRFAECLSPDSNAANDRDEVE